VATRRTRASAAASASSRVAATASEERSAAAPAASVASQSASQTASIEERVNGLLVAEDAAKHSGVRRAVRSAAGHADQPCVAMGTRSVCLHADRLAAWAERHYQVALVAH
jgi:hypothetical protein